MQRRYVLSHLPGMASQGLFSNLLGAEDYVLKEKLLLLDRIVILRFNLPLLELFWRTVRYILVERLSQHQTVEACNKNKALQHVFAGLKVQSYLHKILQSSRTCLDV